jgi:hypothetical protein
MRVSNYVHCDNSSNPGGNANNRMSVSTSSFRDGKGAASGGGSASSTGKGGLCFMCHSPGHRQTKCPVRSAKDRTGDARVAARNFTCAVETPVRDASASLPLSQLSTPNDVEGKRDRQPQSSDTSRLSNVYHADGKTRSGLKRDRCFRLPDCRPQKFYHSFTVFFFKNCIDSQLSCALNCERV